MSFGSTLERVLTDSSCQARVGDIVVYEMLEGQHNASAIETPHRLPFAWRWGVGEVLSQPTNRVTQIQNWRRKEKLLNMSEQFKLDKLTREISEQKEALEAESKMLLSDQNSLFSRRLCVQQKQRMAAIKVQSAEQNMIQAADLVASITDKQWAEVRGYVSPPPTVRVVLEAVLLLLNVPFIKSDWAVVRERARDKDFVRRVSACSTVQSLGNLSLINVTVVEKEYLPLLTVEKVARSSKAAMALHSWVVALVMCNRAAMEMSRIQEEVVVLLSDMSELSEDESTNVGKVRALEQEIADLECQLNTLMEEEENDFFLKTTVHTARSLMGGTMSDLNFAQKAEFYSTMDSKFILTSQIIANLEHDVEDRDTINQTMTINPLKVLMTARESTFRNSSGEALHKGMNTHASEASGSTLPVGFKLSMPPPISADPANANTNDEQTLSQRE